MKIATGKISTKRVNVPDPVSDFTIPDGISWAILKNVGANSIRFNFDDDAENDYWTLKLNELTPIIPVQAGQKFNTDGIGGPSTLEILMGG